MHGPLNVKVLNVLVLWNFQVSFPAVNGFLLSG